MIEQGFPSLLANTNICNSMKSKSADCVHSGTPQNAGNTGRSGLGRAHSPVCEKRLFPAKRAIHRERYPFKTCPLLWGVRPSKLRPNLANPTKSRLGRPGDPERQQRRCGHPGCWRSRLVVGTNEWVGDGGHGPAEGGALRLQARGIADTRLRMAGAFSNHALQAGGCLSGVVCCVCGVVAVSGGLPRSGIRFFRPTPLRSRSLQLLFHGPSCPGRASRVLSGCLRWGGRRGMRPGSMNRTCPPPDPDSPGSAGTEAVMWCPSQRKGRGHGDANRGTWRDLQTTFPLTRDNNAWDDRR